MEVWKLQALPHLLLLEAVRLPLTYTRDFWHSATDMRTDAGCIPAGQSTAMPAGFCPQHENRGADL